jgi:hypothetical protein
MNKKKKQVTVPQVLGIGCAAIVLLAVCALLVLQHLGTRPAGLFKRLIADPIPESVTILHGHSDGSWEEIATLHFTISPSDLDTLIQVLAFSQEPCNDIKSHAPAWWKQNGVPYRISNRHYGHDRETGMWVSADHTEVYYFTSFY